MIPNKSQATIEQQGDALDAVDMTFDQNSIAHLMSILTDLYSDPILATIREIATNGYDSHIAAGNDAPIEVFLPSDFRRSYVVQDYGLGMSEDDIKDIYSKYGASTKRDSNDVAGMLGLGCKAPLTYTAQFTVEAVKDGKRVLVLVSRNSDGVGRIEILDRTVVTSPDGVKVSVPVRHPKIFNQKARRFFKYWKPGTVKVDGESQTIDSDDGFWADDNTFVKTSADWNGQSYVVMGNVPYPVNLSIPYVSNSTKIVHYAPMGAVNFTPSREELHYTQRTKDYLSQLGSQVGNVIRKRVQEQVEKCDNIIDAIDTSYLLSNRAGLMWNGFSLTDGVPSEAYNEAYRTRYGRASRLRAGYGCWTLNRGSRILIVKNYTNKNFSINNAEKCFKEMDRDYDVCVVLDDDKVHKYWSGLPVVDWSDAKSQKLHETSGPNNKTYGPSDKYRHHHKDGTWKKDVLDSNTTYIYYTSGDDNAPDPHAMLKLLPDGYAVANVPKNRQAKFLRNHSNVMHWKDYFDTEAKAVKAKMNRATRAYALRRYPSWLNRFNPNKIDDPRVREIIDVVANEDNIDKDLVNKYYLLSKIVHIPISDDNMLQYIDNNYPQLRSISGFMRKVNEHAYEYVNALYAYREDK